jgi:S1-C subfamily serine protease/DNA-binding NarL/FixJ family response regulator
MRILFLNLCDESLAAANAALAGQGYELTTNSGLAAEKILALAPEVLVMDAKPGDLTSSALVAQLKTRPETESSLKIVMIVHGGAYDRASGLNLGADDVISFPFEPVEFAARIRTQFRTRQPEEELKTMLKYAVQREQLTDLAVEALKNPVQKRFSKLMYAILALSVLAVATVVYLSFSARGTRKETRQLSFEIARLRSGLREEAVASRQEELTPSASNVAGHAATPTPTRETLKAQSDELRKRVAAGGADADGLRKQLTETQSRLKLLESEGKVAETVVHNFGPSVCLLHVVVEFLDRDSGRPLQIAVDGLGKPVVDEKGMVQLDVGGSGPHLQIDVFGTGFLAKKDGKILTNHHVVEPWWKDEQIKELLDHGAKAYALSYKVYFPGRNEGLAAKLDRISPQADVATLQLESTVPANSSILELDDRKAASTTGDPVVLMGYPTGIEGILARQGTETVKKIADGSQDVSAIMSKLASQQLIRPTTTQGHIGDVLDDKIVYDAATTSGGSGGPLFNRDGKVIGINFAVLRGFGGSNLAVPSRYAKDLLK